MCFLLFADAIIACMNHPVWHCGCFSTFTFVDHMTPSQEKRRAILSRTERAMMSPMCRQKVVDRKTEEQMNMLGLKTIDRLATANEVR